MKQWQFLFTQLRESCSEYHYIHCIQLSALRFWNSSQVYSLGFASNIQRNELVIWQNKVHTKNISLIPVPYIVDYFVHWPANAKLIDKYIMLLLSLSLPLILKLKYFGVSCLVLHIISSQMAEFIFGNFSLVFVVVVADFLPVEPLLY